MEGYVKSIKYYKIDKFKGYFLVSLVDDKNNFIGTFGNKEYCSICEFRKETFGIMASVDCFDLIRLGSSNPNKLCVSLEVDSSNRIVRIINQNFLAFGKDDNCLYNIKRSFFNRNMDREVWSIESIKSQSDTFSIFLMNDGLGTFYVTGNVYYGFGYPLFTPSELKSDGIIRASLQYLTFIRSILKFYGTNDLMGLSKNSDIQYKKVSLVRDDNGYIIGIGNKEKDIYLVNGVNTYHILNGEGLHQKMLRFNKHLY